MSSYKKGTKLAAERLFDDSDRYGEKHEVILNMLGMYGCTSCSGYYMATRCIKCNHCKREFWFCKKCNQSSYIFFGCFGCVYCCRKYNDKILEKLSPGEKPLSLKQDLYGNVAVEKHIDLAFDR